MGQLVHKQTGEQKEEPPKKQSVYNKKFENDHQLAVVKTKAELVEYDAMTRKNIDPFFIYTPMKKDPYILHRTVKEKHGFYFPVMSHKDNVVERSSDTGEITKLQHGRYVVVHWNPKDQPKNNMNWAPIQDIKTDPENAESKPAFFININGYGVDIIDIVPFWIKDVNFDSKNDSIEQTSGGYHETVKGKTINEDTDIIFLNHERFKNPMTWQEFMDAIGDDTPLSEVYKRDWTAMVIENPELQSKIYTNPDVFENE